MVTGSNPKGHLLTFILSLASIILYFVVPNNNDKILGNQLNIKINEVEKSINGLNEYIKSQTVKINETNQKLDELKTEHKKLEPIVQIERKSVESLFVISEKRQAKQKWIDYGISFIMGIISTLVCNSIVKILQRKRQKE